MSLQMWFKTSIYMCNVIIGEIIVLNNTFHKSYLWTYGNWMPNANSFVNQHTHGSNLSERSLKHENFEI